MSRISFIIGGAKSGKTRYALELAKSIGGRVAFVATAQAHDDEMEKRIACHRRERPENWKTFEEPRDMAAVIGKIGERFDVILMDCLTLLISNLICDELDDDTISMKIEAMLDAIALIKGQVIIVSNEVGLSIVPENPLARRFRDLAGVINQRVARKSDEVFLVTAGLPLKLK